MIVVTSIQLPGRMTDAIFIKGDSNQPGEKFTIYGCFIPSFKSEYNKHHIIEAEKEAL